MVAFQPDFKKILKLPVARDVARREVAVIIENRLAFGKMMVKPARSLCAQQKIVV